ncbi:MAG TPA: DUF4917 family protein, partial [Solirubrobacterales bacterium]|nr:DUF4917 family protein [Solirubrobacterales bacterium]
IVRHAYLSKGLRSLASCEGSLFVHGHELGDDDQHITRAIHEGKFLGLFVGLEGDPDSERNQEIQEQAEELMDRRPRWRPLKAVEFYDAESAEVWGSPDRPRYGAMLA